MITILKGDDTVSESQLKTREQNDPRYQWDLTPMFKTDEAFEESYQAALNGLEKAKDYEGKLGSSAETLAEAIDLRLDLGRQVSNLGVYAHLKYDQDSTNSTYQQMDATTSQLYSKYAQAFAYFDSELMSIEANELEAMIDENSRLQALRQYLSLIHI